MRRHSTLLLLGLLTAVPGRAAFAGEAPLSAGPGRPARTGILSVPSRVDRPSEPPAKLHPRRDAEPVSAAYPLYRWPLGRLPGDGLVIVNYVDHDPTTGTLDYEGGAHTYDGHRGVDYTLHNFRLMDRGCPIRAASSGVVTYLSSAAPGAFDRNCGLATWPDDGTWLWIDNGDGSFSEYYHLRSWSLTVQVGQTVQAGQMLGLVGSSGYSTAPHLHFETGDFMGGPYQRRDPYAGPLNPLPSLWPSQDPYQGDDPLHFVDLGVFTDAAVGGNVGNTGYCDVQEGIHSPIVFGIHEPHLDLWTQFQGNAGDDFRFEIRRPDNALWTVFADTLQSDARFNWFWAYWFWDPWVTPADYGAWKVRVFARGVLSLERTFMVGPATIYGPRLQRAGRSFRVAGVSQFDTLRTTALSPPVSYALIGAPSNVTLANSVLTVGGSSPQATRSAFFQVAASDAGGRADTAWYHLVDMTKPLEAVSGVGAAETPPVALRIRAAPNPAVGRVEFSYEVLAGGGVTLEIFDVVGRHVRSVLTTRQDPGAYRIDWDGRDERGRPAPSGLYWARIVSGREFRMVRVTLTR